MEKKISFNVESFTNKLLKFPKLQIKALQKLYKWVELLEKKLQKWLLRRYLQF